MIDNFSMIDTTTVEGCQHLIERRLKLSEGQQVNLLMYLAEKMEVSVYGPQGNPRQYILPHRKDS